MLQLAFLALMGILFGALFAFVLLVRAAAPIRAVAFLTVIAGAAFTRVMASPTLYDAAAVGAGFASAISVLALIRLPHLGPAHSPDDSLTYSEVRRAKGRDDTLVLFLGPEGSGKTTLVDAMVRDVQRRPPNGLQFAGPSRSWDGNGTRLTELALLSGSTARTLRFWESRTVPTARTGALSRLDDFDVVIVVIDPTRHVGLAADFPDGMSPVSQRYDANRLILSLVEGVPSAGAAPVVVAALTKSDLLRFAITPALVSFPIVVGPGWHQQLSGMLPPSRWALLDGMGLQQAHQRTARFEWGQGSPIFTFALESPAFESFGHRDLFDAITHASMNEIRTVQ